MGDHQPTDLKMNLTGNAVGGPFIRCGQQDGKTPRVKGINTSIETARCLQQAVGDRIQALVASGHATRELKVSKEINIDQN